MSVSHLALSSSPDVTTRDMDCSTPPPNLSRDLGQTRVTARVDTTVLSSDDNLLRLTASMENLSITHTVSQVPSTCAATPGEVDVASSCSSGCFSSPPPGPSQPSAATSPSHDDTSWASPSEASLAFVKDYVWVYDVKPSRQALSNPSAVLAQSRIPRTTALENNSAYFFRAACFVFASPDTLQEPVYGLVLGAPDAVFLTPTICDFRLDEAREDQFLSSRTRYNVSSAMRFSEPPPSEHARRQLCHLVRRFLPMHPEEAIVPLRVSRPTQEDEQWLADRAGSFENYRRFPDLAKRQMAQIFKVARSALSAISTMHDDRQTHWVTATIPSFQIFPLRVHFVLTDMATEVRWAGSRPVAMWVVGANTLTRATVRRANLDSQSKNLRVVVDISGWHNRSVERLAHEHGRPFDEGVFLDVAARLTKASAAANPVDEHISRMCLIDNFARGSVALAIMDRVYGSAPLGCLNRGEEKPTALITQDMIVTIHGRVTLSTEQRETTALGADSIPITVIQAAFGTGKTVVGAIIAARWATGDAPVLATASTNAAVAQFAQTMLSLSAYRDLNVLRFVADSAAQENLTPTPVDLNKILMSLGETYAEVLSDAERSVCDSFAAWRRVLEEYINDPELALHMTEEDKEEYAVAERHVSRTLEQMIRLMLKFRPPHVLCITTASLLNTMGTEHGAFAHVVVVLESS
ncbi:hypothetical protein RB195_022041 [Necator americanus]|uniref:DNA2/NAM7 helicase helicase domain-containing protein n=1 Tax=Necator americanus TaxID=51031 RepID=A0ABR1EDZ6_NECAM